MTVRPTEPRQGNIAAAAAILVMVGWFAAPVLAATDAHIPCEKERKAALDFDQQVLTETVASTIDSVAADHLLKPRVEATAREVFADSIDDTAADEPVEIEADVDDASELRLRPVTEIEMVPLRRQMYRKDI